MKHHLSGSSTISSDFQFDELNSDVNIVYQLCTDPWLHLFLNWSVLVLELQFTSTFAAKYVFERILTSNIQCTHDLKCSLIKVGCD